MLEINNSQIEFIIKKPFYIFKINNFLNYKFYLELKNAIPKINNFSKLLNSNNLKYSFNSDDKESYDEILNSNKIIDRFDRMVKSENFFNIFNNQLFKEFLLSRISDPISFLKILRPKNYNKNKSSLIDKLFCQINSKIQYSYILNSGKISPHTDGVNKLLSLMLYFPEGLKQEKELGTIFWNSNLKNFKNKHIDNSEDLDKFYSLSEKILKTSFEENTLYGFIKNSNSWHSLDTININENYIRKSININFFI